MTSRTPEPQFCPRCGLNVEVCRLMPGCPPADCPDGEGALVTSNTMDDYPADVVALCTAYESGFGDGVAGLSKKNPYTPWSSAWFAWSYGVRCGQAKRRPDETTGEWLTNEQCDDVIAFLEDYEWTGLTRENVRTWNTAIASARASEKAEGDLCR